MDNESQKLFYYCQYIRLKQEQANMEQSIRNNTALSNPNGSFLVGLRNFGRSMVRDIGGYDNKLVTINNNIESLRKKHTIITDFEAKNILNSMFSNDTYGISKILFATTIIFDTEYNYLYGDSSLQTVSKFLFDGDYSELGSIKQNLEYYYKKISTTELSNAQKGILFGTIVASFVGVCVFPVLMAGGVGASAAVTTGALATVGFADMQVGLGVLSGTAVLLGATLTGLAYGGMKLYNSHEVKQSFKKLSPTDNALYLSIELLIIKQLKTKLSATNFKDKLDELLKSISQLKADLDFYLFIEKLDALDNKKRESQFHNFDNLLYDIVLQ